MDGWKTRMFPFGMAVYLKGELLVSARVKKHTESWLKTAVETALEDLKAKPMGKSHTEKVDTPITPTPTAPGHDIVSSEFSPLAQNWRSKDVTAESNWLATIVRLPCAVLLQVHTSYVAAVALCFFSKSNLFLLLQ